MDDLSDPISERLKMGREAAGLSVDDVVFQTCIPRAVVIALEEGDFSFFASPLYAKSFLAQYSAFLKVEASLWLDALEPGAFVPGETLVPLWESSSGQPAIRTALKTTTPAWVSAFIWLIFSGVLLLLAMKSYTYFEERFASEEARPAPLIQEIPPDPPPPRARVVQLNES